MNQLILEYVEDIRNDSEIDVLLAIGESYSKILDIMCETCYYDIIMESFGLFMEADNDSSNKNKTSKIKALFSKITNFIKDIFGKISGIFKKRYVGNKSNIYLVGNILNIMDALENVEQPVKKETVKEYDISDMFDDIYQEGLFKSPEEKEKAKREKDKAKMVKNIRSTYAKDMKLRELTKSDIKIIVDTVTNELSKEDFKKLKDAITSFKGKDLKQLDEGVLRNAAMIIKMSDGIGKVRNEVNNITKPGYMSKRSTSSNTKTDKTVAKNIEKQISTVGSDKVEHDLMLVEKFADTLGNALNYVSKRDNFTVDNCKRIVYGGHPIKNGLAATADCLFGIVKRTTKILPDIDKYGDMLYDTHRELSKYVNDDEQIRESTNIQVNKTMKALMFVLDSIKEETYGWEDDPFNRQSYGHLNMFTLNAGGPFTLTFKLIMSVLTKDPTWMGSPGQISPIDIGLMATAKALKPTPKE